MIRLNWKPVLHNSDIASLGRTSSFYFLEGAHLSFLFIHEANEASVLIVSLDEYGLTVYHVLEVKSGNFISKITGNSDFIVMLDVNGDLFYLKGIVDNEEVTFNFNNLTSFLSNNAVLTWCTLAKLSNCLAIEGVSQGIAFIHHDDECVHSAVYTTTDICMGFGTKLTRHRLNYNDQKQNYYLAKVTGESAKFINNKVLKVSSTTNEVLLIIEPTRLRFSKPEDQAQICSKPFPIDFQTDSIISVMNFNKKASLFIVCKSGKIVCLKLKTFLKRFETYHLYLGKKVYAIAGYEDADIKLFWSDLKYFYVSIVSDNGELSNVQAIYKIGGVIHLVSSANNILIVITRNACLYETRTKCVEPNVAVTFHSSGLLKRINKVADLLGRLIRTIKEKEDFIQALEISNVSNTADNMYFVVNNDSITLWNNTKYVFAKNLWKIQIEIHYFDKVELDTRNLNTNIVPNGGVTFDWSGKYAASLKVNLFCDIFLPDAIIFIEVKDSKKGNITYKDDGLIQYSRYLIDTYEFTA